MTSDKRYLQLRLDPDTREEIDGLSRKFNLSNSDVVRGILFFGIPVFESFSELSNLLIKRLVKNLKGDARLNSRSFD